MPISAYERVKIARGGKRPTGADFIESLFTGFFELHGDRRFADDAAAHNVRCAVETVWVHPLCSPEKTARLIADVGSDNLYAILDPVNLLESDTDPHRAEKTRRAIELYGDKILAVHWKDARADANDPAIQFALENENVTVITEGLSDETLKNTIQQLKQIREEN